MNAIALNKAFETGQLVISKETLSEFIDVLYRPKFDKYLSNERRDSLINIIEQQALFFQTIESVRVCRDPEDDKFLELAVACQASCLISGDLDILVLHPFMDIPILNAVNFLKYF